MSGALRILPSKARGDGVRIYVESFATVPFHTQDVELIREDVKRIASAVRSIEFVLVPCDPEAFRYIADMIIHGMAKLDTILIEDGGGDVEELCRNLYRVIPKGGAGIRHVGLLRPDMMEELSFIPKRFTFLRTEEWGSAGEGEDGGGYIPEGTEEVRFLTARDPIPYIPKSVTTLTLGPGWTDIYIQDEDEEDSGDDDTDDDGALTLPWNRGDGGCSGVTELTLAGDVLPKTLPEKIEHLLWTPSPKGMTPRGVNSLVRVLKGKAGRGIRKLTMRVSFGNFPVLSFPLEGISGTKLEKLHLIIHSDELFWNDHDIAKLIRENKRMKILVLDIEGDGIGPASKKIIAALRDHPALESVRVISSYEKHREYTVAGGGNGKGGSSGASLLSGGGRAGSVSTAPRRERR